MEEFDPKKYITRYEKYLAKMAGGSDPYPDPITRHEKYLAAIIDNMGETTEEKIVEAVDAWLDDHINPDVTVALDDTLAVEGAAADAKAVGDVIAPQFSTSASYSIGDYCLYQGTLYRFVLAHSAGAWSASDVEATDVSEMLSKNENELDSFKNTIVYDDNIIHLSSETMVRNEGDGTVSFFGENCFSYTRVTAGNNVFGFVIDTQAQKKYNVSCDLDSITGESGMYFAVIVCPTESYNYSGRIATSESVTTPTKISVDFTAVNQKTSIWFYMRRYTKTAVVNNVSVSDNILRYKYYLMDYKGTEVSVFNKILCIGDSLTEGTFNLTIESTITNPNYSYPTFLKKLTGCNTVNMGNGGYSSVEWYDAHSSDDLSGYDCAIIEFGVNDMRESVSISDFTNAYHNIIDKLNTQNNGIKIFLTTVIPAYSDYDRRYDAYDEEIRRIANEDYANVYLIDLYEYSICKLYTPYAQGHLTAIGYQELAHEIATIISYTIHSNPSDFANVQFIGTNYAYTE